MFVTVALQADVPFALMLVGVQEADTEGVFELPVTTRVTEREAVRGNFQLLFGAEIPLKVTTPVCFPTGKLEDVLMVTLSEVLPEGPFANPEESAEGETESQLESEIALHVSFDPGAPSLLTCTCPLAGLPAVAVSEMDAAVELFTAIFASGSQRTTNATVFPDPNV
jgi:hypothetical protein